MGDLNQLLLGLFPFIFDYRYLHPPVTVNMIGRKRAAG
jgi:hypothetical protein